MCNSSTRNYFIDPNYDVAEVIANKPCVCSVLQRKAVEATTSNNKETKKGLRNCSYLDAVRLEKYYLLFDVML